MVTIFACHLQNSPPNLIFIGILLFLLLRNPPPLGGGGGGGPPGTGGGGAALLVGLGDLGGAILRTLGGGDSLYLLLLSLSALA